MDTLHHENIYNIIQFMNIVDIYHLGASCKKFSFIKKILDMNNVLCFMCDIIMHSINTEYASKISMELQSLIDNTDISWKIYAHCAALGYKKMLKIIATEDNNNVNYKLEYIAAPYASSNNKVDIITWLLKHNIRNSNVFSIMTANNQLDVANNIISESEFYDANNVDKYRMGVIYQLILNNDMHTILLNINSIINIIVRNEDSDCVANMLIENNDMDMIKLFLVNCCAVAHAVLRSIIKTNNYQIVQWCIQNNLHRDFPYFFHIIESDNISLLECATFNVNSTAYNYYSVANRNNSISGMKALYMLGVKLHHSTLDNSIKQHTDTITEWLMEKQCPCSIEACVSAVKFNKMDVLIYYVNTTYCVNKTRKCDSDILYNMAIIYGRIDMIKYMYKICMPLSSATIASISKSGNPKLINWFWKATRTQVSYEIRNIYDIFNAHNTLNVHGTLNNKRKHADDDNIPNKKMKN